MISELDNLKNKRYNEIDERTSEILEYGFIYEGYRFKHRISDNINYLDILCMKDCLTYPQPVNTAELGVSYDMEDADEIVTFSTTRCAYKQATRKSGYDLKVLIKACETIEAVNAIVDDRTPQDYSGE